MKLNPHVLAVGGLFLILASCLKAEAGNGGGEAYMAAAVVLIAFYLSFIFGK